MIGKLRGKIDAIFEDRLILDVGGVGYNIYASSKTLGALDAKSGKEISLMIETIVREDHIHLYGFSAEIERNWFNELCKVKGVGSKVALRILGAMSIDDIVLAIKSADKTLFSKTPGIGPKLALRIVSELKDSAGKVSGNISFSEISKNSDGGTNSQNSNNQILNDAISALENLGYKRSEIYSIASKKIAEKPEITLETLITLCLRDISKK